MWQTTQQSAQIGLKWGIIQKETDTDISWKSYQRLWKAVEISDKLKKLVKIHFEGFLNRDLKLIQIKLQFKLKREWGITSRAQTPLVRGRSF